MNLDIACYKNPSTLVALQISNRRKSDLAGLERYKNLVIPNQTELDISGNLLTSVINELFLLKFLKKLNLSNNTIQEIFSLPRQLEALNLSENFISQINENILTLSNLHTLDISFNQIQSISSISRLSKLKCLYVNNNRLTSLNGIEYLTYLIELDLSDNLLKSSSSISALNLNSSLVVVNIENNPITQSFERPSLTFSLGSKDEFPKDFIEISLGLYFRSPEKLRKIKSSRYRSKIKEFKNQEKLLYASPDWGNSKIEDEMIEEESFDEKIQNTDENSKRNNEENEEVFGKKVINIAKLDLDKINEKVFYEKSSTKPESSLETLFEELISYCRLEESKDSNFSYDKYENAINVLKVREMERTGLAKNIDRNKREIKVLTGQLKELKTENDELNEKIESLKQQLALQDQVIFQIMNRETNEVEVQTDLFDEQFLTENTLDSGLSSFSQLPDLGEFSRHLGGNEYLVHSQIGQYIQKLLEKISYLVKKKRKLRDENRKLNEILKVQRRNVNEVNN